MSQSSLYNTLGKAKANESQRRFVVLAVYFVFFLYLVEGALRKWFFPGLAGPLTLLRDPFLIALYVYSYLNGWIQIRGIGIFWIGFASISTIFSAFQFIVNGLPLVGWLLGVRTYWLYMPLAFVIAKSFRRNDVVNFAKFNLWLSLPYAVLIIVQASSDPYAFINRSVGSDSVFTIGAGIVRPYGLFTFTAGNVLFTSFVVSMFFLILFARSQERPPLPILIPISLAVIIMSILTGSRAIYFYLSSILIFALISMLIANGLTSKTLTKLLVIALLVFVSGLIFVTFFSEIYAAMMDRFERASYSEGSIWNRAFRAILDPIGDLWTAPFFGYGIGLGAPGIASYLGLPQLIYGESDLQRNINELGVILGSLFITMRFFTVIYLIKVVINLSKSINLMFSPLLGNVILPFAIGQLTHTHLVSFPSWILVGLILTTTQLKISDNKAYHQRMVAPQ